MGIEKGRPVSRPSSLRLGCWEVSRKTVSGRDIGEQAPLHHIRDTAKIEPRIVSGDPRVWDAHRSCQFDYGRHGRRHLAVVHRITPLMLRPNARLD
jgi:hypothetical protein